MTNKIDYGTDMPSLVEAASKDPEAWHRAMWGTMKKNNMSTCSDCGYYAQTPEYTDPRNPPLDEGKCLCKDCYIGAVTEVLDDSIDAVEDAVQLSIGVIPGALWATRLQQIIDWADNL